jgi:hypothetical protein
METIEQLVKKFARTLQTVFIETRDWLTTNRRLQELFPHIKFVDWTEL